MWNIKIRSSYEIINEKQICISGIGRSVDPFQISTCASECPCTAKWDLAAVSGAGFRKPSKSRNCQKHQRTAGGYYLARPASEISVSDIVYAIDGDYYITDEKTADPCKDEEISDVIQELIIDPLNRQTKKVLQGVTLEDMEEEYLKHNEEEYMYYIWWCPG